MTHPHGRPAAPRYRSRVTVAPVVRAFGFLIPVVLLLVSLLYYLVFEPGPATVYLSLAFGIGLLLAAWVSRMSSVRIRVRDGVLTLSKMSFDQVLVLFGADDIESVHARLHVAEISYAGGARFGVRDFALRTDGNFTKRRPGEGMEFVTRDGRYLITRAKDVDGLKRALLAHGMNPAALQVPFPGGVGSPETMRERRAPHPGTATPPQYGR